MAYPYDYTDQPVELRLPPLTKQQEEERKTHKEVDVEKRQKTGVVFGSGIFELTQDAPVTHIRLDKVGYNRNVPTGVRLLTPSKPMFSIKIVNMGPGAIMFSTNLSEGDNGTALCLPNQSEPITVDRPILTQLNIRAVGANASVCINYMD